MIERLIKTSLLSRAAREKTGISCPPDEEIATYIDGGLSPRDSEAMERHFVDCAECISTLAICFAGQEALHHAPSIKPVDVIINFFRGQASVISQIAELVSMPMPAPVAVRDLGGNTGQGARFCRTFPEMTAEFLLRRHDGLHFDISVFLRNENHPLDRIRISLVRDEKERESLLSRNGEVVFNKCPLGEYAIIMKRKMEDLGRVTLLLKDEDNGPGTD